VQISFEDESKLPNGAYTEASALSAGFGVLLHCSDDFTCEMVAKVRQCERTIITLMC